MKQQKLKSQEKKTELKKGKLSKSDLPLTKEHKLRELMNIYGCSDRVKKSQSDSGSKSGVSKRTSSKKMVVLNNCSSTTSSIAISKKSKRKKKKIASKIDYDLQDEDFAALDKSSRVSIRRKNKPKSNTAKLLRKTTLKRKIMNQNNESTDSKLSKSYQTILKDSKYATNKTNNANYPSKEKNYKNLKQIKFKNPNQSQRNTTFNQFSEVNNLENDTLTKSKHKLFLNTFGHKKQSYTSKTTTKLNDYEMQSKKQNVFSDKQSHNLIDGEKLINSLQKKISKESKLNRSIFSTEKSIPIPNNFLDENSDQPNAEVGFESMRDGVISQTAQHYALPTQSSRSKEVERFLSGHYQYLPFVIGQSTNKSHNLWVNIQEALSLIKQKIPQTADVHSVVYESEIERPLSVSSKLTSKTNKKTHQCPAMVSDGLYDIPEGSTEAEEAIKSWENHPECIQANIDPNHVRPRCSCIPQQPFSYKKVLRQLFGGGTTDNSETTLGDRDEFVQDKGADNYTAELKKTLISFTQEFEELNKKYEEMLADQNTPKEDLERTEILLKNKEEEIKEILTRFNEVKEITDRNHLEGNKTRGGFYNLESYKSTTSVRLAQTLRRVQIFKESLKRRPSGAYPTKNVLVQSSY
uniref:Uncharacterized protein n=1 Tax=Homalodisca liturata TaxID=320908 RepID=A0A1B6HNP7_9HEMI